MSFVSNKFVQNCFRKELKKVYSDKGLLTPIEKVASSSKHELSSTEDLFVDLVRLGEELRNRGFFIQADALEEKAFLYKKAYNEPTAQPEEQEEVENVSFYNLQFDNVLEFAHGLPDFQGFDSQVEGKRKVKNINETQQDIMKMVQKQPTGLYSVGNHNVVELIKVAQEQNVPTVTEQNVIGDINKEIISKLDNWQKFTTDANGAFTIDPNVKNEPTFSTIVKYLDDRKVVLEKLNEYKTTVGKFWGNTITKETLEQQAPGLTLPSPDQKNNTYSKTAILNEIDKQINANIKSIKEACSNANTKLGAISNELKTNIANYTNKLTSEKTIADIETNIDIIRSINAVLSDEDAKLFNLSPFKYKPNYKNIKKTLRNSLLGIQEISSILKAKTNTPIDEAVKQLDTQDLNILKQINDGVSNFVKNTLPSVIKANEKSGNLDELKAVSGKIATAAAGFDFGIVGVSTTKSAPSQPSGGSAGVSGGKSQQQAKNQNVVDMQSIIITIRNAIQGKQEYTLDALVSSTNTQAADGVWGPRTSKALEQLQAIIKQVKLEDQLVIKPSNIDDDAKTNINILSKLKQKLGEIHSDIGGKLGVNYYDKLPKQYVPVQLSEVLDDDSITLNRNNLSSLSALLYSLELEGFKK